MPRHFLRERKRTAGKSFRELETPQGAPLNFSAELNPSRTLLFIFCYSLVEVFTYVLNEHMDPARLLESNMESCPAAELCRVYERNKKRVRLLPIAVEKIPGTACATSMIVERFPFTWWQDKSHRQISASNRFVSLYLGAVSS